MAFITGWGLCSLCMLLWLMSARTVVEASGTLDNAIIPLQNLYVLDTSSGRVFWQSRYGEQNSTWQVNNSVMAQGVLLRNDSAYLPPQQPSAVAIGVRVIALTWDARLCEYDTSQQGKLLRCSTALSELPSDMVHLPAQSAQDPEKLLLYMPQARRIALVDYQSLQYVGTWTSFQQDGGNVSMEYLNGSVLVAIESRDAVLLYDRLGTLQQQAWVHVPRPRYLSVSPEEGLVYVSSVEQDSCSVYTFRSSDAASVAVVTLDRCDVQRQVYSFGVDQGTVFSLYRDRQPALRSWSLITGLELLTPSPLSLRQAALTRADDDTGDLGLVDAYSWHAEVQGQPLVLAACQGGGGTWTSQTLALYTCPQDPSRLIAVDPQSAYAMYRNDNSSALCFQRHLAFSPAGTPWTLTQYDPVNDTLQLSHAVGVYQLTGVCADLLSIPLLAVSRLLPVPLIQWPVEWYAWDSMRGYYWWSNNSGALYRLDGTLVQVDNPTTPEDTLLMAAGQLFALVQQESGLQLYWLRVLDSNVTQATWIDAGQVTDQVLAGPLVAALRAYPYVPPLASEVYKCAGVEECLARNPLLLAFLVVVSLLTIVITIVVVLCAVCRRKRDQQQQRFSTDYNAPNAGQDHKPLPVLRWLVRQLFCGCKQCYEDTPPYRLRSPFYNWLGGQRERGSGTGYHTMTDTPGAGNVYIEPPAQPLIPPGPGASLLSDSAASTPSPTLPAASGDSFVGRPPFSNVDLNGRGA
jgi:hypothetical protein